MRNIKQLHEFLVNEISTKAGLDDVIKGRTNSIEGIKMSKDLAQGMKDWIAGSSYGRKYGKHINKGRVHSVLSVANSWGIERYLDKKAQKEWKELYKNFVVNANTDNNSKGENVNEGELFIYDEIEMLFDALTNKLEELGGKTTDPKWRKALLSIINSLDKVGNQISKHDSKLGVIPTNESVINETNAKDLLQDAKNALTKTTKGRKLDKGYVKDYLASIERLAKNEPQDFVKDYGDFSVEDWFEDIRYNMANENVNESTFGIKTTGAAAIKSLDKLCKDLDKAGIKYKKNRLSLTLSVIDLHKSDFKKAEAIVNKHMKGDLSLMIAKESVNESLNENKFDVALNKMDEWLPDDPETMERYLEIMNQEGTKAMEKFFIEYGNEDVLSKLGLRQRDMKKLAKMLMEEGVLHEVKAKKVTKQMWRRMSDDKRFDALLSVIKDPDDAEEYIEYKWEELPVNTDMYLFEREFSEEERKELAKKGLALPNGSFPIVNIEDLKDAIKTYGLAKNKDEAAKWIAKRAKALGAEDLIPDTKDFQKALKETDKKGTYIPFYESFKQKVNEADEEWSDDVKTKWSPPEGTFTKSAKEVADVLKKNSDDLQQAMSRLNFYINRAGDGLDKKTKAELEKAKELLRKLY